MARHLLVGDGTASNISSGVEAAGAIGIQKLSASGPVDLVAGDTIADSPQIGFLQGTSGNNIVTPWIYGRDVINYSERLYAAASDQSTAVLCVAATNTTDKDITLSFIDKTGGGKAGVHGGLPFSPASQKFTITTNASGTNSAAEMGDAFGALMISAGTSGAYSATSFDNGPSFIDTVTNDGSGTLTFIGFSPGDTDREGNTVKEVTQFEVVLSTSDGGATSAAKGGDITITTTAAQRGWGDGLYIRDFEESLMGANYGYYNRVHLPKAPTTTAVAGTNYDTLHIAATKDGSSASQINGVDNIIDISLAMATADADWLILKGKLNPWMVSAGLNAI